MDAIYTFISSLRWQDLLDICICSYILLRLYAFFRRTAAFNVMVGLAFLWLIQGLSLKLGLIVLSYSIQVITPLAAIIIVVIFRNEIRTVFRTKNIRGIFWGAPQKIPRTSLETISESAFEMGEKQVGALLVIPGKDDLEEHVQNGVSWQGVVSKEMVKSVFWRGNPVHDGAAIVDGDRISRVGCILPLSFKEDLPAGFGTRHRAAVGLSEQSDALVVVVSEETGRVITVKSGEIRHPGSPKELNDILEEHKGRKGYNERAQKGQRVEMVLAASISFLLVLIVWFMFTRTSDTLVSYEVPIQYAGRAAGVDIVSASDDTVTVQLIGAKRLMKRVGPEKMSVIVDLGDLPMGENKIKILPGVVSTTPGVDINRVTPSEISVTLDRTIKKDVPVQIDWGGELPGNMLMVEASVQPSVVKVTGRSILLAEVETLYTEKIYLDDVKGDGKVSAKIAFPEAVAPSTGEKERVTVSFKVARRLEGPDAPPSP